MSFYYVYYVLRLRITFKQQQKPPCVPTVELRTSTNWKEQDTNMFRKSFWGGITWNQDEIIW